MCSVILLNSRGLFGRLQLDLGRNLFSTGVMPAVLLQDCSSLDRDGTRVVLEIWAGIGERILGTVPWKREFSPEKTSILFTKTFAILCLFHHC